MIVFALVREDQNEHGYIDTPIAGIFGDQQAANAEALQCLRAAAAGFIIEDKDCSDPAWQVAWKIEEHSLG